MSGRERSHPISFLSEHSVEYCLVNHLTRVLNPNWDIVPLFIWLTREGSNVACFAGHQRFRVIVVFPRGPKILHINDNRVEMKINEVLLTYADHFHHNSIPVICGVPIISSLDNYRLTSPCAWFHLTKTNEIRDHHILIDTKSGLAKATDLCESIKQITEASIISMVNQPECKTYTEVLDIIRNANRDLRNFGISRFSIFHGQQYRPFYLFAFDK